MQQISKNMLSKNFSKRFSRQTRSNLIIGGVLGFCNVTKGYYALHDIPNKKKNIYLREYFSKKCPLVCLEENFIRNLTEFCCHLCEFKDEILGSTLFFQNN